MQAPRDKDLQILLALEMGGRLLDGRRDDDLRVRLEGTPGLG